MCVLGNKVVVLTVHRGNTEVKYKYALTTSKNQEMQITSRRDTNHKTRDAEDQELHRLQGVCAHARAHEVFE